MRHLLPRAALCLLFAFGSGAPSALAGGEERANVQSSSSPYIVLDAMPISIIRDGVGRGLLAVEIGIDTETMDERAIAEHLMPRLVDLYLQTLNLYADRDLRLHYPPDVEIIRSRLQEATDEILGADKARVLMRQVIVRRSA